MQLIVALIAGAIFGAGLTISGMANPQKVLNFLDIASIASGKWDPTLLMVFVGALPVMFLAYRLQGAKPWLGETYQIPRPGNVDRSLVLGSALFGIGWGMAGLCPGPAVVALGLASKAVIGQVLVFFAAMLLGVWIAIIARSLWQGDETDVAV
jgi:uncharacterized protein